MRQEIGGSGNIFFFANSIVDSCTFSNLCVVFFPDTTESKETTDELMIFLKLMAFQTPLPNNTKYIQTL